MNSVAFGKVKVFVMLGLLFGAFAVQICSAADPPIRTWTDCSGKYTTEASFVEIESGSVRLLKGDGTSIAAPFKLLSSSDQNYVRSRLRHRQAELRKKPLPVPDLRARNVGAADVDADATTLYGINWYPTESVSKVASGKYAKPVMWLRVLGSLDGFM